MTHTSEPPAHPTNCPICNSPRPSLRPKIGDGNTPPQPCPSDFHNPHTPAGEAS